MKYITAIVVVLLFGDITQLTAQDEFIQMSKWYFGVNYSVNNGNRIIMAEDHLQTHKAYLKEHAISTRGFNTGFSILYRLKDNIELEIGGQFARHSFAMKGITSASLVRKNIKNYYIYYIELPVRVHYRVINNNRYFAYVSGGFSGNFKRYEELWLYKEYNDGRTENHLVNMGIPASTEWNRFIIASTVGVGFGYNLADRLQLKMEPTFRYSLEPYYQNSSIMEHTYSLGMQFVGVLGF